MVIGSEENNQIISNPYAFTAFRVTVKTIFEMPAHPLVTLKSQRSFYPGHERHLQPENFSSTLAQETG